MALFAPCPVHIASDSLSFVNRATAILNGWAPKKQWGTMPDGDLWQCWMSLAEQRGHTSIRLTHIKGHADDAHVQEGIISERDRLGNHEVDAIADRCISLFAEGTLPLAEFFVER